jgi:hypothetical protein
MPSTKPAAANPISPLGYSFEITNFGVAIGSNLEAAAFSSASSRLVAGASAFRG